MQTEERKRGKCIKYKSLNMADYLFPESNLNEPEKAKKKFSL